MDVLRSCYSTQMRFFRDKPDIISPVRWYFCPPGALPFPDRHHFGSLNYGGKQAPADLIGEVKEAPRPWRNGSSAGAGNGHHFCGPLDVFRNGVDPNLEYPMLVPDVNGDIACCTGLADSSTPVCPSLAFADVRTVSDGVTTKNFNLIGPGIYGVNFDFTRGVSYFFTPRIAGKRQCPQWILKTACGSSSSFCNCIGYSCTLKYSRWVEIAPTCWPAGTIFTVTWAGD